MSHTPRGESVSDPEVAVGDLLSALEDSDCRGLLRAASGEALSARELSEACDLPLSTTYRKVDTLASVGLLEKRVRLRESSKPTSEYALGVEQVCLSLSAEGIALETTPEMPGSAADVD